jgi:hypothetical protein
MMLTILEVQTRDVEQGGLLHWAGAATLKTTMHRQQLVCWLWSAYGNQSIINSRKLQIIDS